MNELKSKQNESATDGEACPLDTLVIPTEKRILDACCGSKMFWFDKENDDVLFADIRNEEHELCDGRDLEIKPDMQIDFRDMPFADGSFKMVVFDPPHMNDLGESSWLAKKYGRLFPSWKDDIAQGFSECFRVLEAGGTLIFKWNETQIKVSEILDLIDRQPLFGHKSGKQQNTHWMAFMK
jgi:ubiquinone/menaquinone biosynthesis C-methylase UbiE